MKSQSIYHLGAQKRCLKNSFWLFYFSVIAQTFCCKTEGKYKVGLTTFKCIYSFVQVAHYTNLYCQSFQSHLISESLSWRHGSRVLGCQNVKILPLVSTMVVYYGNTNPSKLLTLKKRIVQITCGFGPGNLKLFL